MKRQTGNAVWTMWGGLGTELSSILKNPLIAHVPFGCSEKRMGRKGMSVMMERKFRIDLTEIEGDGEFLCPACSQSIDPEDYSGTTYKILDSKTTENGTVEEVVLQCKECGSIICLEGFDLLEDAVCSRRTKCAQELAYELDL